MTAGFPTVGGAGWSDRPTAPVGEPGPASGKSFAREVEAAEAGPPPEVRAEVQAAARAADRLHELGRELHFKVDGESGRLRIEVRDLDGNVLRTVPPTEALEFAAGQKVE